VPELPDITIYIEALERRIQGQLFQHVEIGAPFLLRTAVPPVSNVEGKKVVKLRRLGKRICIGVEGGLWLVLHLMIAGRLHWREPGSPLSRRQNLAAFVFAHGTLTLTEAGTRKRASLHVVEGETGIRTLDQGGLEIFDATLQDFAASLQSTNHTLKRALTDPRILSGIGNAYSDEILFEARLSPIALTQRLTPDEVQRLFEATRNTLTCWVDRLRAESAVDFPEKVTAFRPEMAVHGKYQQPCPRCRGTIQRIRYASNETNYCPNCQTAGKLLADRALSRLLRGDWPKSAEELESRISGPTG
jgi:formamidopyrimidine-DNA glycosylase